MKKLIIGLLILCSCSQATVEPDFVAKYKLKRVNDDGTAMVLTVEEAEALLAKKQVWLDSTTQFYTPKGARIVVNDNAHYFDLRFYGPKYPIVIRIQVVYLYCDKTNQFVGAAVISKAVENHTNYTWGETDSYANITNDGKLVDYGFNGGLFYKIRVNDFTYQVEATIGIGGNLSNSVIKSKIVPGEKCPDWTGMVQITPIYFNPNPDVGD